jgi:hypothetical protein
MARRHAVLALALLAFPACSTGVDLGGSPNDGAALHEDVRADTSETGPPPSCPGYAAPDATAKCNACKAGSAGCPSTLQANGCYGGYYCELSHLDCKKPSDACGSGQFEAGKGD